MSEESDLKQQRNADISIGSIESGGDNLIAGRDFHTHKHNHYYSLLHEPTDKDCILDVERRRTWEPLCAKAGKCLGLRFVYITGENFAIADSPTSLAQWRRLKGAGGCLDKKAEEMPHKGIPLSEIEVVLGSMNRKLAADDATRCVQVAIPSYHQWELTLKRAGLGKLPRRRTPPTLKAGTRSPNLPIYDLQGVILQLCKKEERWVVVGDNTYTEERLVQPYKWRNLESPGFGDEWGWRAVLVLSEEIRNRIR